MDKNELIEEFSKCRENLERYAVSLRGNPCCVDGKH